MRRRFSGMVIGIGVLFAGWILYSTIPQASASNIVSVGDMGALSNLQASMTDCEITCGDGGSGGGGGGGSSGGR